jgi:hypothetical protein
LELGKIHHFQAGTTLGCADRLGGVKQWPADLTSDAMAVVSVGLVAKTAGSY